jgi:peptide/nickel transport system substrate-binding protein
MSNRTPFQRRAILLLCAAITGTTLSCASTPSDEAANTVTIGFSLEPTSLDISGTAGAAIPQVLLNNVYEGLLRVQNDGEIVGALAESYTESVDGLTFTFTLVSAKFHDGSPVTAKDVVWSFNRVLDPTSTAVLPEQKKQFVNIASVQSPNESTVVFSLKNRDNDFIFNLTQRGGIVLKTGTNDLATKANGAGPFKFEAWNRGSSITLVRNEMYYGTKPKIKTAVFRYITDATALSNAMLSGQIDIMSTVQAPELLDVFKAEQNLTVYSGSTNCEVTLGMNNARAPFNNKLVRQAVRQAIDKKNLIKTAWSGYGMEIGSFVPPTDPWFEDLSKLYPYDVAKSKSLLETAGYANGLTIDLDLPPIAYATNSGEFIAASLAKVGIKVNLKPIAWAEWIDRVFTKKDYDMTIVCHIESNDMGIYANPEYYFGYNSTVYQGLIKMAAAAETQAARADGLKKAARVLANDSVSDWLWLIPNLQVAKKTIGGIPLNTVGDAYTVDRITVG